MRDWRPVAVWDIAPLLVCSHLPSPDGEWLLVSWLERPFSFAVGGAGFALARVGTRAAGLQRPGRAGSKANCCHGPGACSKCAARPPCAQSPRPAHAPSQPPALSLRARCPAAASPRVCSSGAATAPLCARSHTCPWCAQGACRPVLLALGLDWPGGVACLPAVAAVNKGSGQLMRDRLALLAAGWVSLVSQTVRLWPGRGWRLE